MTGVDLVEETIEEVRRMIAAEKSALIDQPRELQHDLVSRGHPGDDRLRIAAAESALQVRHGRRYRLIFRNGSGDQHPMHLHRHSFEVVQIGERKLSGLMKDTINVMPLESITVEFVADNPGDTLLHCHQQLHMDYGFMQLIRYIE